jgi:hypothetical protein
VFGTNTGGIQLKHPPNDMQHATELARVAMGIDWLPGSLLAQAIPPAFTSFIGQQLLSNGSFRNS